MKGLPLGFQTFQDIIKEDRLYVDKTDFFIDLIKEKAVFLSRPRRFGKSLLLSTLEGLFSGDEQLFEGLKISEKGYKFEKFPVIYLNMIMDSSSPDLVREQLFNKLNRIASKEKLELKSTIPGEALEDLISALQEKYNKNVVVLIDEYDDPVSANLDNLPLAKMNGEILRAFYGQFKSCDRYLRFVFVTGVTRYAMMGLSAGLNQLEDISFDSKYATICGFTPAEMDQYFGDRYSETLEALKSTGYLPAESLESDLRQKILYWYDGYAFDGKTRVLNPISLLRFFKYNKFAQYWLKTAPSIKFLSNIMGKNPFMFTKDKLESVDASQFEVASIGDVNPLPLLFQTGYLTIDKIVKNDDNDDEEEFYKLKTPNNEVNNRYFNVFIKSIANKLVEDNVKEYNNIVNSLINQDAQALTDIIAVVYSRIPAEHHRSTESFYHAVLLAYCLALFPKARAEEPSSIGDLDIILPLKDDAYVVIELKYEKSDDLPKSPKGQAKVDANLEKLAVKALDAIQNKKYGETYKRQGIKLLTVGLGVYGRGEVKVLFGS